MYTARRFRFVRTVQWTWTILPLMGLWSLGLTAAHNLLHLEWLRLLGLPVGLLGTAVSFYLGFKGNAAYERLWEARKIWGGIVNTSRTWGVYVTTLVTDLHVGDRAADPPLPQLHRELLYRHMAWLGALRTQLRRRKAWEHDAEWNDRFRKVIGTYDQSPERLRRRIEPFLPPGEADQLLTQKNQATQLLRRQGERIATLFEYGRIDDFRHMELVKLLEEMYTLQGRCERIKNFPLPRQYATANHWFVMVFLLLLPAGLLGTLHGYALPEHFAWGVVPASMILGWVFYTWDMVLDYSENPFEGLINDIPMDALSRTIEIDLREMLGETDLPAPVGPVADGHAVM